MFVHTQFYTDTNAQACRECVIKAPVLHINTQWIFVLMHMSILCVVHLLMHTKDFIHSGCACMCVQHSHVLLLKSVSACLLSTLSFPLCLYRLWLSSSAQPTDKIRACSACPLFPQYHILSLFSSVPLSQAKKCVCVCV